MNSAPTSLNGEVLRIGAVALLAPVLGLLLQLAHAYFHSSTRYFLDNAILLNGLAPVPLAILFAEALITLLGLLVFRRFVGDRWRAWALPLFFCFAALWTLVAIFAEAQTK